jgi:hypothetical protein
MVLGQSRYRALSLVTTAESPRLKQCFERCSNPSAGALDILGFYTIRRFTLIDGGTSRRDLASALFNPPLLVRNFAPAHAQGTALGLQRLTFRIKRGALQLKLLPALCLNGRYSGARPLEGIPVRSQVVTRVLKELSSAFDGAKRVVIGDFDNLRRCRCLNRPLRHDPARPSSVDVLRRREPLVLALGLDHPGH